MKTGTISVLLFNCCHLNILTIILPKSFRKNVLPNLYNVTTGVIYTKTKRLCSLAQRAKMTPSYTDGHLSTWIHQNIRNFHLWTIPRGTIVGASMIYHGRLKNLVGNSKKYLLQRKNRRFCAFFLLSMLKIAQN